MLKNKIKIILKISLILLGVIIITSCSTKKNRWNRRVFHNLTSHYNVWWNGNQSVGEGEKSLKESVKEDYTKVLPVFNYGTKEDGLALNSQMDRAIEKSAICIQRHSMRFNGKEYVRWIDDAFLLMAKGHFYKQDYIAARRTFDYVANQYRTEDITHTANLWLAKTYIETEQFQKAEALLQSLMVASANETKLPRYVRTNIDLVLADYYIAIGKENDAVKYLKSAALTAKDRYLKTRALFILGQIYENQHDDERATEQFKAVIKKHPNYEMTFEAKMNLAKCLGSSDTTQIMKMFRKMLKDVKNNDYHDRIYYAMSEVALKADDEPSEIKFLRKSVATSTTNTNQKVISALRVATVLFDNSDYVLSQAYYDTVVMTIDRNYPGYDSLLNLSVMLGDLVVNLTNYQLQDSLLRLAEMDSTARNAIIDQIIVDYQEEQKRAEEEKELKEQLALLGGEEIQSMATPTNTTGSWYYYNQQAVGRGLNEFKRKWGNIKLEDFWMISNIQSINADDGGELTEGEDVEGEEDNDTGEKTGKSAKDTDTVQYTPLDRQYYLKQLPFTDEQKAEANLQIAQALNNIGYIYYEDLEDYSRSIDAYLELDERYPQNENELSSWYYLYRMYFERGENDKAEKYKSQVLEKYPDSNHAKIILDPEYFIKEAAKGQEASQWFEKTYDAYNNGQYQRVRMNVEKARELYQNDTALMPRFEFLDAIALGYVEVVDSMAYALLRLVSTYPTSSIKPHAMEVLLKANDMYNLGLNIESARPKVDTVPEVVSPYTFDPADQYFVMIICNSKNVRINPLKVRLSDFNKNNFRPFELSIKNVMLNRSESVITVETFENMEKAKDYNTAMFLSDYLFGGINEDHYKVMIISKTNYPVFYKLKDVDEYINFWKKNTAK